MQALSRLRMPGFSSAKLPMLASFVLFIALCVSVTYWALLLVQPAERPVVSPLHRASAAMTPRPDAATRLLGGRPATATASNFQIKGIILSTPMRDSVALLGVNGKPAKAYKLNAEILPGVTLQEVNQNHVLINDNGSTKRVDLPANNRRK